MAKRCSTEADGAGAETQPESPPDEVDLEYDTPYGVHIRLWARGFARRLAVVSTLLAVSVCTTR